MDGQHAAPMVDGHHARMRVAFGHKEKVIQRRMLVVGSAIGIVAPGQQACVKVGFGYWAHTRARA